jgi:flavodoxin
MKGIRMSAVVVYESMFGATRQVAEALARGLGRHTEVTVLNVNEAGHEFPVADLVLVGAPTHVHGLSSPSTREEAVRWTKDPARMLTLEHGAPGIGVREWLDGLTGKAGDFVAFDTRADIAELLSGSAGKHIQKALKKAGGHPYSEVESFLVHDNELDPEDLDRAEALGDRFAAELLKSPGS